MGHFEILISGAGISGLIAGIRAQQLGFQSCIIEKQKKFVETLKGEYIQPSGLRTLQRMGIATEIERLGLPVFSADHHFWPLTPFRKPLVLQCPYPTDDHFPDHSIAIPHLEYKNALVKIYQGLGGDLKMDSVVEDFETGVSHEVKVRIRCGEEKQKITAKHIIVSEGTFSALAKKQPFQWADHKDANSYMVGGTTINDSLPAGRFITAQSKEGLFCAFKITPSTTRVYFYKANITKDENPFRTRRPESFLEKSLKTSAIAEMFRGATLDKKVMAAPYVPRYALNPSLGIITLTGDSAGASHPLGAFGMSSAAADGLQIIELYKQYVEGKINLNEMNEIYNQARLKRYLTSKFVSDSVTFIMGGTSRKSRAVRRLALRTWSTNERALKFCGRLLGGMLTNPLSLNDFLYVWGIQKEWPQLSFVDDFPKVFYGSKELTKKFLSPKALSAMLWS
jgi:2-polyprenyl-6-methoxyphenol hydroxylase-like FAD-dependent oxidoreductase